MTKPQILAENFNFYTLPSSKFKTNLISVYVHVPIERETVTRLALIPSILQRGCEQFPTFADLFKHTEDLFGANFNCDLRRKGDNAVLFFAVEFANPKYIGEDITRQTLELLRQVMFFPVTKDDGFSPDYVTQEKDNLARFIDGIINDKKEYASHRCMEIMFDGDPYGIPEYGYVEDLPDINGKNLFELYKDIMNNCQFDVFFSGEFDETQAFKQFSSVFADEITAKNRIAKKTEIATPKNTEPKFASEDMDVNQSKLNMGFICQCCPTAAEYFPLLLFSAIFGGGPFSKLFLNVREKLSLCYSIGSRVDRLKGIMTVSAGIAPDKFEQTKTEILKHLVEMQNGDFSDDDVSAAKKYVVNGLESMKDSLFVMEDYTLSQSLLRQPLTIDDFIVSVNKVSKNDIVLAAKKIELDTTFLLNGKLDGGEA